ncbi:hypothetical protein COCSADRAFT_49663, partial [Bipolaris sorokiniana ND90Pr]
AAWNGHAKTVQALVDEGADINGSEGAPFGQCSLYLAARNGYAGVFKLLAMHDESLVTARDEYNNSVLNAAAQRGNADMVRLLLEKGAPPNADDSVALSSACSIGAHATVRVLLEHGAQTETRRDDDEMWPPLHTAIQEGAWRCVQELLLFKSDANHECSGGTPLMFAVKAKRLDMAKLLVEHGADVNKRHDEQTATALQMAVAQAGGLAMVEWLVGQGADPDLALTDRDNDTALNAALERDTVLLADVKLLVYAGSNIDTTNAAGLTPLHKAIDKDKLDIVRFLLKRG